MFKRSLMLATVLMLSVTMGCTTVQKWTAGGAAVGAATGAAWACHHGTLSVAQGAGLGALGGGLIGALVGDAMDERNGGEDFTRQLAERDATIARLQEENRALQTKLQQCEQDLANANRKIESLEKELAELRGRGSRTEISLLSDVLFRPGSATLTEAGRSALNDASNRLKSEAAGKFIMVEGHTDSQPIQASGWKDNWDLGAARALTVLKYIIAQGVDASHASAATFAYHQPVADNATKEGRAQNRRAVIVIYNDFARAQKAPAAPAAK